MLTLMSVTSGLLAWAESGVANPLFSQRWPILVVTLRNNWVFAGRGLDDKGVYRDAALLVCGEVKIKRHKKIRMGANPFDPVWSDYFDKRHLARLLEKHQERSQKARLLKGQKGLCAQPLTAETGYHLHHVIPQSAGGTDEDDNLVVIHPVCHQAHHVHHPAIRSVAGRSDAKSAAKKGLSCMR